jgi:hypothetical protein
MDDWDGLRAAVAVVAWVTVLGGLTLGGLWFARGGGRAVGPEDEGLEPVARRHARGRPKGAAVSSFSSAQVGVHGLLGVLTASLITYAVARGTDRSSGYPVVVLALAVTAIPGVLMFRKWITSARPAVGEVVAPHSGRVEDHLPKAVVYAHGAAALATALLVVLLFIVD